MNLTSYSLDSFESILVEAENESSKSTVVLGLVEEHSVLYFVVRQRYPAWTKDLVMDRIRVSEAVRQVRDKGLLPSPGSHREILRIAFEQFVRTSPFRAYVREKVNVWATGQFFKQLRAIAPSVITLQSRPQDEQGSSNLTLQSTGRETG